MKWNIDPILKLVPTGAYCMLVLGVDSLDLVLIAILGGNVIILVCRRGHRPTEITELPKSQGV